MARKLTKRARILKEMKQVAIRYMELATELAELSEEDVQWVCNGLSNFEKRMNKPKEAEQLRGMVKANSKIEDDLPF